MGYYKQKQNFDLIGIAACNINGDIKSVSNNSWDYFMKLFSL